MSCMPAIAPLSSPLAEALSERQLPGLISRQGL